MNKKIKVIIDDVELEVCVSEEELAKLTKKEQKKTGYERAENNQLYYSIDAQNEIFADREANDSFDSIRYKNVNYYTEKTLAENNARADKLMRQLRRFAAENCAEVKWDNSDDKYYLMYDYLYKEICIDAWKYTKEFGQIYFDTEENAQKAIDAFKDELIWYFTEYRDRV